MSLIKSNFQNWPALSDFFDDDWLKTRLGANEWSPAVNVVDNEDNYEVEVAAPGLKKEDFSITMENGVLTITGKTEKEMEEKEKNYTRKEFSFRSFAKSFTLPENVKEDGVAASYEDGVLKLTLTKSEKELPPRRQVVIQ